MEIDKDWTLIDMKNLIIRKKNLILAAMGISIIAAAIYSITAPKQYETSAILQVAAIKNEVLDSNAMITQVINSDGFLMPLSERMKLNVPLKKLRLWIRADCDPQLSRDVLRVRFLLPEPTMAATFTDRIVDYFHEIKKKSYEERMKLYRNQYDVLAGRKKNLESNIARYHQVLEALQKESNPNVAMILLIESRLTDSTSQSEAVSREMNEMDMDLFTEENTHDMRVLSPPANPAEPSGPNLVRNIVGSALFGLIVALILILFAGYLEKGTVASKTPEGSDLKLSSDPPS